MPDGATGKISKAAVGYRYCNKLFANIVMGRLKVAMRTARM